MLILSIDIGFKNPSFVLTKFDHINNIIKFIKIYTNIQFNNNLNSINYLNYFFSKNLNLVLIEQQIHTSVKNISLMSFIHGYFISKNIPVDIKKPISSIQPKITRITTRKIKKDFSINLFNYILKSQNINLYFKSSDICDASNMVLYYLYKDKKKYLEGNCYQIENIQVYKLEKKII